MPRGRRLIAERARARAYSRAASTKSAAIITDSARPALRIGAVWKDSSGSVECAFRLRQSFQSARPISGSPCAPRRVERVAERGLQVIAHRRAAIRRVFEWNGSVEQVRAAGLAHVGRDAQHQPERIVVEPAADLAVAGARQRLVLVICAAVALLRGGEVREAQAHLVRDHVGNAETILVRIPEADAAAASGLEQRGAARELEGHHALVGIPGVDEFVQPRIRRVHLQRAEERVPAAPVLGKCALDVIAFLQPRFQAPRGREIRRAVVRPLLALGVLGVAGRKYELLRFARLQRDGHAERGDRPPAVDAGVARTARTDGRRIAGVAVGTEESAAVGVEAFHGAIHEVEGVMRAPLAVTRDVADHRAVHEAFREREIALQVAGIVVGVPQAPLDVREDAQGLRRGAVVAQLQDLHLGVLVVGDEHEEIGVEPVLRGRKRV